MKYLFTLWLGLLLWPSPVSLMAQTTVTKQVLIVNGGQFDPNPGFPANPANIQIYNPEDGTYRALDTIGVTSVQDILVEGSVAFLAAQDSIVRYDLAGESREAIVAFGGESTICMAVTDSLLLVGNFYLPFGSTDPYPNNLRVFDRKSLTLLDSVPALALPVKSIVVEGEYAYLTQNYTSSSFSDSAGFLVKLNLNTLVVEDTLQVNQNAEDLGPLVKVGTQIFGLNGTSNSITTFDLNTQLATTDTANADIDPGSYGSRFDFDSNGDFYTVANGDIAQYDLLSRSIVQAGVVDTVISGFALDTLAGRFYITQTDYFSYTGGIIYDQQGGRLDTLYTGYSPEVIELVYNQVPEVASVDTMVVMGDSVEVLLSIVDGDPGARVSVELIEMPNFGEAYLRGDTLVYTSSHTTGGGSGNFSDSVRYRAMDEWGDADTAWLRIEIDGSSSIITYEKLQASISPNPSTGLLKISLAEPWSGVVQIIDIQGRVLKELSMHSGKDIEWRDLADIPAGTYMIRGIGNGKSWQSRWLKL